MAEEKFEMTQEELTAKIQAAVDAQVSGLKSKNDELLGKLKKNKLPDGVDLQALQAAADELKTLKTKQQEEEGNFKKLYETTKSQADKDLADLKAKLEAAEGKVTNMSKTNEVSKALSKHKLIPGLAEIAVSTILPEVGIDESGKAMVGSKKVQDFVDNWVQGDVGKHFIQNANSGGGANGSGDSGGHAEQIGWFKKGSSTFNVTKQAQLRKSDPALAERLTKLAAEQ